MVGARERARVFLGHRVPPTNDLGDLTVLIDDDPRATVALGLSMTAIGIVGWTVDEVMLGRETSWLGWYTVFALFGSVAPLFALLAQPHRGAREQVTPSTAVDIAGIAVITGFLYSHFVVGADLAPLTSQKPSVPLVL